MSDMKTKDLTIKILEEIRDSVRETNGRLDQTNSRLDQTNSRLDQTNAQLEALRVDTGTKLEILADRIVETEVRLATAVTAVAGTLHEVKTLLQDHLGLRDRVGLCEADIARLKERTGLA